MEGRRQGGGGIANVECYRETRYVVKSIVEKPERSKEQMVRRRGEVEVEFVGRRYY